MALLSPPPFSSSSSSSSSLLSHSLLRPPGRVPLPGGGCAEGGAPPPLKPPAGSFFRISLRLATRSDDDADVADAADADPPEAARVSICYSDRARPSQREVGPQSFLPLPGAKLLGRGSEVSPQSRRYQVVSGFAAVAVIRPLIVVFRSRPAPLRQVARPECRFPVFFVSSFVRASSRPGILELAGGLTGYAARF